MNSEAARPAGPPPPWTADLAQRMLAGEALPGGLDDRQVLELGWALKQVCYDAWSSQPQQAEPTARALAQMLAQARSEPAWPARSDQELLALARWTEGIALITASRMDEAAATLDHAAWLFDTLGQPGHAAQTQVPRIMALTLAGHHAEAAACAERTLEVFVRLGDSRSAGKVSLNLGGLHLARDEHRRAATQYRQSAVLFARCGDTQHSVMADIGLANALRHLGELDESQRIYARARMRAATHGLPVLEAMADEAVALLELSRGRFRDALQGLERTRRLYEALSMPQQVAIAEKQLGLAYLELRLLPEAVALFDRAHTAMRTLGMQDESAWVQLALAQALALQGATEQAQQWLERAAVGFGTGSNQVGLALVTLAQAELAMSLGQAERALSLANAGSLALGALEQADKRLRAEAIASRALLQLGQADDAQRRLAATLAEAQALQLLLVQVHCLTGLGLVAQASAQAAEAAGRFEAAITLFEEQRRVLPCDEMRSAFQADHLRPYLELLRMALQAPALDGELVLQRLDRLRARSLGERLLQCGPQGDGETRELRTRLNWLYRQMSGRMDGQCASPAVAAELRRTEQDLLERARRSRLLEGHQTALATALAFETRQLCRRLGPGDAVVEYGELDDELFACVVRHDGVQVVRRLASWRQVADAVRGVRFQIDALRHGSDVLSAHMDQLQWRAERRLQELHRLVWQPLAPVLASSERVMVVALGQLGAVPFAALHDGQQHLLDRHQLAMAPSAQIAVRLLEAASPKKNPRTLVMGESRHLLHAHREAHAVAALFPGARCLVDQDATIGALRQLGADADIVHLACHAEFRHDSPMFSALHLADGPVTVELVEGMRLPGSVVVLSACETGLGGQPCGDELVGLVRAFMVAGASRVVASLWPVDDAVTVDYMCAFYQGLGAGQAPAAALHHAQQSVRQAHPHPFHWAPFVMHGAW